MDKLDTTLDQQIARLARAAHVGREVVLDKLLDGGLGQRELLIVRRSATTKLVLVIRHGRHQMDASLARVRHGAVFSARVLIGGVSRARDASVFKRSHVPGPGLRRKGGSEQICNRHTVAARYPRKNHVHLLELGRSARVPAAGDRRNER